VHAQLVGEAGELGEQGDAILWFRQARPPVHPRVKFPCKFGEDQKEPR